MRAQSGSIFRLFRSATPPLPPNCVPLSRPPVSSLRGKNTRRKSPNHWRTIYLTRQVSNGPINLPSRAQGGRKQRASKRCKQITIQKKKKDGDRKGRGRERERGGETHLPREQGVTDRGAKFHLWRRLLRYTLTAATITPLLLFQPLHPCFPLRFHGALRFPRLPQGSSGACFRPISEAK